MRAPRPSGACSTRPCRGRGTRTRSGDRTRRRPLDVYLFPAVVGGGLGDIETVLLAGRVLQRAGCRILLFRRAGRPLPLSVEGPWEWPAVRRVSRPDPGCDRAITVSAEWGVSAAPGRPEPFGRAGPWALEAEEVEKAYGSDSVVHVSFEEFARTLTSREETSERYREGGLPARTIPSRLGSPRGRAEIRACRREYRKFRAFDRPNVLAIYSTLSRSPAFGREFPEAVQSGPLWPGWLPRSRGHASRTRHRWVWYASPSSSPKLVEGIDRGISQSGEEIEVEVRSPRPFPLPTSGSRWRSLEPEPAAEWGARFQQAELRIVTGSRTLLEAIETGGPFLYFNGVIGDGRRRRRHRPEKIISLLAAWKKARVGARVAPDLHAFSTGRSVAAVVCRAASDPAWRDAFPRNWRPLEYRSPFDEANSLLDELARRWAEAPHGAAALVSELRSEGRRAVGLSSSTSEV